MKLNCAFNLFVDPLPALAAEVNCASDEFWIIAGGGRPVMPLMGAPLSF